MVWICGVGFGRDGGDGPSEIVEYRRYVGMVGLDFLAGDDQFSLHVETIRREIFESTRLDS